MNHFVCRSSRRVLAAFCALLTLPSLAFSQSADYPPRFEDAHERTYKTIDDVDLKLWIFDPANHKKSDRRPAAVFFFGGGWKSGNPAQFEQHCRYLASRGMVAITADYRVRSRHENLADRCVADAKSAIRWVRVHAEELGVDPQRIVAGGGSAGGHLAACTAVIADLDEPDEDTSVSSVPNALVLFNPALLLAPYDGITLDSEKVADIATRTGVPPERISPIHHVRSGLPPMIVFHGKDDPTVPYATIDKFRQVTQSAGNSFDLRGYPGQQHGFFNYGRGGKPGEYFARTVHAMDKFLAGLGYLDGDPSIAIPQSENVHVRSELPNARIAIERDKQATIAFMGGSITEMEGYRPMIMQHLSETYPDTKFKFINAGISSTCSTTGAFRLERDILNHSPHLVFIEFAVNDDQDASHESRECIRGMEGIIRHIRSTNPQTEIVVTYFVNPSMLEQLQRGETPTSISAHERVASHYGVTSINLAAEVAKRMKESSLTWETYGGTHPKKPGNRIAAELNIDALQTAWSKPIVESSDTQRERVPKAIDRNSYAGGRLVHVSTAKTDKAWRIEKPDWPNLPGSSRSRYTDQELLCATDAGAELSLSFRGTAVGAFVLAGPDAGSVEASIDGGPMKTVELYHRFSKGLHYPRTVMFDADLKPGPHELVMRVAKVSNPDSNGNAVRILNFVVNATK